MKEMWKSLSHVWLSVTPWTIACQAPLSMRVPRQEYWSGQPFSSSRDLPNIELGPRSSILQVDSLPSDQPGKPNFMNFHSNIPSIRAKNCMQLPQSSSFNTIKVYLSVATPMRDKYGVGETWLFKDPHTWILRVSESCTGFSSSCNIEDRRWWRIISVFQGLGLEMLHITSVNILLGISQSHTLSRLQRRVVNVAYFYVRKKMK